MMFALLLFAFLQPAPIRATRDACKSTVSLAAKPVALAGDSERGRQLVVSGRVLDYGARPLSKAAVVAYQADASGLYNPPKSPTRVPRLRAVAITADDGSFAFRTIFPGAYPNLSEPAHIHLVVTAPAHRVRNVDLWFEGDRLITPNRMNQPLLPDAATFVVTPRDTAAGAVVQCDIQLDSN